MGGLRDRSEGRHRDDEDDGLLLSAEEAAGRLGVDRVTVWRWCREGRMPWLKIGRLWRVRGEVLEALLREADGPGVPRPPK